MVLRAWYAMWGTELGDGGTRGADAMLGPRPVQGTTLLSPYAPYQPTHLYQPTGALRGVRCWHTLLYCPPPSDAAVLRSGMALRLCYRMCGTHLRYFTKPTVLSYTIRLCCTVTGANALALPSACER
eukprot:2503099-Rhodomonas_salina.2